MSMAASQAQSDAQGGSISGNSSPWIWIAVVAVIVVVLWFSKPKK